MSIDTAQRYFDELHAPDGQVPTLDDYTPILEQMRREREALIAKWEQHPTRYAQGLRVQNGVVRARCYTPVDSGNFKWPYPVWVGADEAVVVRKTLDRKDSESAVLILRRDGVRQWIKLREANQWIDSGASLVVPE